MRIFHLEPLVRAPGAVWRAQPLARNAFAAQHASMLVDDGTVAIIGRVNRDPVVLSSQCPY